MNMYVLNSKFLPQRSILPPEDRTMSLYESTQVHIGPPVSIGVYWQCVNCQGVPIIYCDIFSAIQAWLTYEERKNRMVKNFILQIKNNNAFIVI